MTVLCGICIAAEWGCEFAYVSFAHIWFFTPCFKMLDINCSCMKKIYSQCVGCLIEPCCMACGMLFHQFKK
ncbi:hypothetical protein DPMN_016577 [Dreissena polymorpha]|uniref:Caveolin n=2 Tax=Dreissena polymorpha TaxID=45954 RepID=A0A9D4NF26_DREPO|nr:hypothetical protein DPMN_016577 [Dreissena polymorpha]